MNQISRPITRLLLVTPDEDFYDSTSLLIAELKEERCEIKWIKSYRKALIELLSCDYNVCLLDSAIKNQSGLKLLREANTAGCPAPVIFLAEKLEEQICVEAMQAGAIFCSTKKEIGASFLEHAINYSFEQKIALTELRENQLKFRNLVETLPVMIYAVEPYPPYSPLYISSAFQAFGYPLEEWQENADFWVRAIHADDRAKILQETEKAMKSGTETDFEYRIIAQDKTEHWVRDRGCFIRDEKGNAICWQGIILDITKQKRTEQELRALFEAMADVILVLDKNGRYLKIAPTNPELLYRPPEELIGKTLDDVFPAEEAKTFLACIRAALETKQTQMLEYTLSICEQDVWFVASVSPMTEDTVVFVARDITERKRAEEALKESEARYRNLFENANDLIYVHDLKGNFISINQAAERVFGYSRHEAVKMNIKKITAPEHLEFSRKMLAKKIAGAKQTAYEIDCITRDGRRITLEVYSSVIYKDGAAVAIQGIARDITERKLAEKTLRDREEQYRDLFENANDLIYTHDLNGNFTSLNRAGEIITGYSREEALQMNVAQVVAPDYLKMAREIITKNIAGELVTAYELEITAKSGERVSLELSTRIIYQNGQPVGIQGIGRDITERKRTEESLVNSERLYRLLSEGIKHQIWTAYPDGKPGYYNGRTLEYLGRTWEQMQGESWQSAVHPDDLPACMQKWTRSLKTGEDYEIEFRLRRNDGAYRWFHARATAARNEEGKIIIWFGTNTDIDDQKIAEAKLNHIAGHDTLTNLPNRAKFMNHLERAVARSDYNPEYKFAVLFLDLDRFKLINDSLGHSIGDKLLVAIAERLECCVRPGDIVARLGGDEFTVLLNNISGEAEAVRIANRFLEKLSAPLKLNGYEVFSSASIGIIVSDEVKRLPEDFLRDADTAMYRAKEAGKARYEIFDREMHIRNMKLLQLENDLRRAIEQNEFRVYYQPIIELDTGEIREFEALIRWQHPQHGLVLPNDFIQIAEETGLIIPIGKWILEEACRQTAEWQKRFPFHKHLLISVNLSAKQLMHPELTEQVKEVLKKTKLNPRCLKLEVTESMVMENGEQALSVISELHSLGISISTDDFGTGYSSLSYLHRFPFNRLKIDRSFVAKMDVDKKSEAIVRTILLLGQNLNIEVIAEGIETERQLINLRQLGCKTGQGFLFSKPVNAESADFLLENGLQNANVVSFYDFSNSDNHQLLELDKIH